MRKQAWQLQYVKEDNHTFEITVASAGLYRVAWHEIRGHSGLKTALVNSVSLEPQCQRRAGGARPDRMNTFPLDNQIRTMKPACDVAGRTCPLLLLSPLALSSTSLPLLISTLGHAPLLISTICHKVSLRTEQSYSSSQLVTLLLELVGECLDLGEGYGH